MSKEVLLLVDVLAKEKNLDKADVVLLSAPYEKTASCHNHQFLHQREPFYQAVHRASAPVFSAGHRSGVRSFF